MPQDKNNKNARRASSRSRLSSARKYSSSRRGGRIPVFPLRFAITFILVLSVAFVVIAGQLGNVANASGGPHPIPGPTRSYKGFCGNPGQQACPPPQPRWFSISSESSVDVAKAIVNSKDFGMLQARYGNASVDTPVLIHSFGPRTGDQWYDDDHWVVSARNASGKEVGLFDFVYDSSHHLLRFSAFAVLGPQTTHTYQAFPYISSSTAVSQLASQRKLQVLAGTQPELIFYAIDPRWRDLTSPVHLWSGGGDAPLDPMWYLVGSDKHNYFVGGDLKVYTGTELPLAPNGQP